MFTLRLALPRRRSLRGSQRRRRNPLGRGPRTESSQLTQSGLPLLSLYFHHPPAPHPPLPRPCHTTLRQRVPAPPPAGDANGLHDAAPPLPPPAPPPSAAANATAAADERACLARRRRVVGCHVTIGANGETPTATPAASRLAAAGFLPVAAAPAFPPPLPACGSANAAGDRGRRAWPVAAMQLTLVAFSGAYDAPELPSLATPAPLPPRF